ncbi:MAG: IS4 family transposase [Verrucomicrobiales bacterium]
MQEVLWEKRRKLLEGGVDLQQQVRDEIDPSILERFSTTQRVRSYPDPLVFWAFLFQVSHDDSSCAHAVSQVQQWAAQQGLPVPSASTASYCEARGALPEEMLRAVHRSLCGQLDANLPESSRWRGLRPLVEDGTSAQMPDTGANRASWPCPPAQNEGCGLPVIKLDGLIDLSHGGLRDFAHCDLNTSGLCAHQKLQGEYIKERDVLIADRLYSGYEIIAGLRQRGAHFIGRTHQSRKIDFRKGRRIGPDERIVVWNKPRYAPKGSRLDAAGWEALPASLEVRLIRCQGPDRQGKVRVRYVVTTLLDHETYPAEEVASLYLHRWEIEVRFRDIKTTLGMELLRTKSPELILKEVLMHMIFYNLIRLLMLKAGVVHGVNHRRLSFRGTQQVLQVCREGFVGLGERPILRERQTAIMWERIAERSVVERPGRNEPRRVKRRPKCTQWMQKPRHEYFEHFRSEDSPRKILDEVA